MKQLIDAIGISNELGISPATLFRMIKRGEFPSQDQSNDSGGFVWAREVFDEWKAKNNRWLSPITREMLQALGVCRVLNVSMPKLYRMIKSGELPEPTLVRRSGEHGLYGGLVKVWNKSEIELISGGRKNARSL